MRVQRTQGATISFKRSLGTNIPKGKTPPFVGKQEGFKRNLAYLTLKYKG